MKVVIPVANSGGRRVSTTSEGAMRGAPGRALLEDALRRSLLLAALVVGTRRRRDVNARARRARPFPHVAPKGNRHDEHNCFD